MSGVIAFEFFEFYLAQSTRHRGAFDLVLVESFCSFGRYRRDKSQKGLSNTSKSGQEASSCNVVRFVDKICPLGSV